MEIGKRHTGFQEAGNVLFFDLGGGCTDMFTSDNSVRCTQMTCELSSACITLQLKSKVEVCKRLLKLATFHIKIQICRES